jgi:hypothetical protein
MFLLRAAFIQRCTGEGELVFRLTGHDAIIPGMILWINGGFYPIPELGSGGELADAPLSALPPARANQISITVISGRQLKRMS